jgi:hypothetical protein
MASLGVSNQSALETLQAILRLSSAALAILPTSLVAEKDVLVIQKFAVFKVPEAPPRPTLLKTGVVGQVLEVLRLARVARSKLRPARAAISKTGVVVQVLEVLRQARVARSQ